MKSRNIISVFSIIILIEFFPIIADSQEIPEGKSYPGSNTISSVGLKDLELSDPESTYLENISMIKFKINKEGNVRLIVTDPQGQTAETLVSGEMEPGEYTIYHNVSGQNLVGEYKYILQLDDNTVTKSILIKAK